MDSYQLIEKIEEKINQVMTKDLDMSFNEIADMYQSKELNISPDFQRLFRWSDEQQSRFIESLILALPIPPIYLIENNDLTFDLIDGLQRISTYLRFNGLLDDRKEKLVLTGCDLMDSLNGLTIDDLPTQIRIRMKRTFVRTFIIKKGSDSLLGYYMFKRLNYGGSLLSPQEIRSVNLKLIDKTLIEYVELLSQNEDLINTLSILTDEKKERQYGQELVIRYLAIKYDRDDYSHHLNDYLNHFLEKVAKREINIDRNLEKSYFEKLFVFFNALEGANSFRKLNDKKEYTGPFVVYIYEALTIGLINYIENLTVNEDNKQKLLEVISKIKMDEGFKSLTMGAGINNLSKLSERIEIVEQVFHDYGNIS